MIGLITFLILTAGGLIFLIIKLKKHKSLYPFIPFRYDFRKRRDTFLRILKLLDDTKSKIIIETGTSRKGLKGSKSNGAATIVFGKWAKLNKAHVYSVDISMESIVACEAEVKKQNLMQNITIHHSDSIEFLKNFKQKVDFLYLDSYDYSLDKEVQIASQKHHLNEFKAIENKLHKNSIIMIDDCDLSGGGKGKLVIEYMLQKDWIIDMEKYQVILLNKHFKLDLNSYQQ
ncbi:MAG: class I SAM-dependent methyltransferase [Flavobacteriaceae bacterium]|nr:class I SAM-dependent methyltransferase [Flavobacteriaceae bacterium]